MKRKTLLFLVSVLLVLFTGCTTSAPEVTPTPTMPAEVNPVDMSVRALKGPTAMGMIKFMDDVHTGVLTDNNYDVAITPTTDELVPLISKGDVDIAALPANLASVLYNNTEGAIQVLAINTLGVLYIVEGNETVADITDLSGKTIYASGKGATPEYALNYILEANGLTDDVTIEWKSEQAEVVTAIANDEDGVAMLPQPFVTTAQTQNPDIKIALDLTEEWNNTETSSALITGVVVARKDFVEENKEAVDAFLMHYKGSADFVNTNLEEAAALVGKYEIVPEAVALTALPYCGITLIDGDEMQTMLSGYLAELHKQNPASVGGELPADEFYYGN